MSLIFIMNTISSLAQHSKNEKTMENLRLKSKKELVELALEILKEKQPSAVINADDFEVSVLRNDQDVLVEWQRKVTFIPLKNRFNGIYQYDIMVSLRTNCISKSHYSDLQSNNYFEPDSLFSLTNDDNKIIEIAKKVYDDSTEKGQIYVLEKEKNYEIIQLTQSFRSSQLIEKGTFGKGVLTHKEKVEPYKSQNYFEIK